MPRQMTNLEPRTWTVKQSAGRLDIYLYDDIEPDSFNWWTEERIESETSARYISKLIAEAKNVQEIHVYINSYGGDVKEGLAIYNQLKRHPARKTVHVDGFACSIAAVISQAGDKVIMGVNSLMMIHHAWTIAAGNAEELRKAADDVEIIDSATKKPFSNEQGISSARKSWMKC